VQTRPAKEKQRYCSPEHGYFRTKTTAIYISAALQIKIMTLYVGI